MIDWGKDFIVGEKYILDKEYNNSSTIKLISKGRLFCRVEDDKSNQWDTTLIRLTPKEKENEPLRNS